MILKTTDIIASGAYADIFRPPQSELVYKLFTSGRHRTNEGQGLTRPEDDDRRRKTFVSECEAYERAAQHPFLRNHIPQYFQRHPVQDVTDLAGRSVAALYMLDLCYVMRYVDGSPLKLGMLTAGYRPAHIEQALQDFRDAGISHLIDASIFSPDDPEHFTFIDFAIDEFQPLW